LPTLSEIRDIEDFEPQLSLAPPAEHSADLAANDDVAETPDETASDTTPPAPAPDRAAHFPSPSASDPDAETTEQDA
jgi:hypothetical protein